MGPFCGASLNPRALWAKNRLKGLLRVDAGDEGVGFGGDDVVDVGLQLLVDRYGSLAGGGECGSAGAVALDELATQLPFGLSFTMRHALEYAMPMLLAARLSECSRAMPCSSKTQPWPNTPGRSLSHA